MTKFTFFKKNSICFRFSLHTILLIFFSILISACTSANSEDILNEITTYHKNNDKGYIDNKLVGNKLILYSRFDHLPIENIFEHELDLSKVQSVSINNNEKALGIFVDFWGNNCRYRSFTNYSNYLNRIYEENTNPYGQEYSNWINIITFEIGEEDKAKDYQAKLISLAKICGAKNIQAAEGTNMR